MGDIPAFSAIVGKGKTMGKVSVCQDSIISAKPDVKHLVTVYGVFRDVCRFWRVLGKNPLRLRRSGSEKEPDSPDTVRLLCSTTVSPGGLIPATCRVTGALDRRRTEGDLEEKDESDGKECVAASPSENQPFRERASTDGHLTQRPWRWRYPPPNQSSGSNPVFFSHARADRRMSFSMRGNNSSY